MASNSPPVFGGQGWNNASGAVGDTPKPAKQYIRVPEALRGPIYAEIGGRKMKWIPVQETEFRTIAVLNTIAIGAFSIGTGTMVEAIDRYIDAGEPVITFAAVWTSGWGWFGIVWILGWLLGAASTIGNYWYKSGLRPED